MKKVFKGIVFDLDDTLMDTTGQLVEPAVRESCEAMIRAGLQATVEECVRYRRELMIESPSSDIFRKIIEKFQTKENIETVWNEGFRSFYSRNVNPRITAFGETPALLSTLKLNYALFLVTSGSPPTQQRKVELLNIGKYFRLIKYVDIALQKSKKLAFQEVLLISKLKPEEVLCVGNRIDAEIGDAKDLGMKTCHLSHGEHRHLRARRPEEIPDYKINSLRDLVQTCRL